MSVPLTSDEAWSLIFPVIWRNENGSDSETDIVVSNNPSDPGGYTRGGIALNENPDMSQSQLDAMTYDDFATWYKAKFFISTNIDLLPWPVSLVVCDAEVNEGTEGAKALQKVLGVVVDGDIGPKTQLAAAQYADPKELAALVQVQLDNDYRAKDNFQTFGKGWIKRLFYTAQSA